MFKWLNKQGVESDDGFVVQCVDRFTIEYREGGHVMSVAIEAGMLAGKPCIIADPSAFRSWNSSTAELPTEEQLRIQRNFVAAMEFQGLAVDL